MRKVVCASGAGGAAWGWLCLAGILITAGPARADFIEIVYNGLTGNPGLEVSEAFPPSPVVLDRTRDQPHVASAETIVDSRGIIRTIYLTAPAENDLGQQFSAGPHSVRAIIDDTARFTGRGQVTWGYHIVGIGVLPSPPLNNPLELSFDEVFATLSGFVGGQEIATAKFGNQPIAGLTLELPNEPFGIDLNVQKTFMVDGTASLPDTRPFTFEVGADGVNGASLNLFDTVQVFAILPPGVSVLTDGGFSAAGGATAVPEPSTLLLVLGPVALLVLRRRRRGP